MALLSADEITNLAIGRMVLHEVGPKPEHLRLFNGVIDPGDHREFFRARIADANKGSAHRFLAAGSALRDQLRRVRDEPDALEDVGKSLAREFDRLHRGNARAGAFALFELAEDRSLYGIIKFDNIRGIEISADAETHARLQQLRTTIMESRDALQKAAIIRLTLDGDSLVVRDRLRRAAAYFPEFLGSERTYTETELTRQLSDALYVTAEEVREDIGPRAFSEIRDRIYRAIQDATVYDPEQETVLTAVFGAVPDNSPIRTTFVEQLQQHGLEDEQFTLVKDAVPRPTRGRIRTLEGITLEYGLQLEGTNIEVLEDGRGGGVITIRTARIEREQLP